MHVHTCSNTPSWKGSSATRTHCTNNVGTLVSVNAIVLTGRPTDIQIYEWQKNTFFAASVLFSFSIISWRLASRWPPGLDNQHCTIPLLLSWELNCKVPMNGSRKKRDKTGWQPWLRSISSAVCKDDQNSGTDILHMAYQHSPQGQLMPGIGFCEKTNSKGLQPEKKKITEEFSSGHDPEQTPGELWLLHNNVWERWCLFLVCVWRVQKWQTFYFFTFMFHDHEAECSLKHSVLCAIHWWCQKGWINLQGSWATACSLVSVLQTNFFVARCKEMASRPFRWRTWPDTHIGTRFFLTC